MISSSIKERMNKEIIGIKKLYQATIDGDESSKFHKKCDNIPNTLVLYKTEGDRRFGAFISESWKSKGERIVDKNCFLFSLDKKKLYPSKNNIFYQIPLHPYNGPCFCIGDKFCVKISNLKDSTIMQKEKFYMISSSIKERKNE